MLFYPANNAGKSNNPTYGLLEKKISPLVKSALITSVSALAVGALIGVIHFATGGAIGGALSAVLFAVGPFLASAAATLGALVVANPFAAVAILAAVVVIVAGVIASFVVKDGIVEKKTEAMIDLLRNEGVRSLVEYIYNQEIELPLLFKNTEHHCSVMEEARRLNVANGSDPNLLGLLKDKFIECIQFDSAEDDDRKKGDAGTIFAHLAMIDYAFAKECVKSVVTRAIRLDDDTFVIWYIGEEDNKNNFFINVVEYANNNWNNLTGNQKTYLDIIRSYLK